MKNNTKFLKNLLLASVYIFALNASATAQTIDMVNESSPPLEIIEENYQADALNFTQDPCPVPEEALSETPNDLKKIQEDITRFTLCLQRAQLLNRLNELGNKQMGTELDEKIRRIVEENQQTMMMTIPAPQFTPDISGGNTANTPTPTYDQPLSTDWEIVDITGQSSKLSARLRNSDGRFISVNVGDSLPDTDINIKSIKNGAVTAQKNEKTVNLKWFN